MLRRKLFLISREIIVTVVRIEIQEDPALFQDSGPFPVGFFRMRQRPGQVSGNHHIKGRIRELRLFRIHDKKLRRRFLLLCQLSGMVDHMIRQINSHHLMASCREHQRKKAGASSHIQNLQFSAFRKIFLNL